ncbi:bifunctional anthranilate synthase component I family protein/aminotransferase class IV [Campylobacter sp. MIT 21-1685]|uniref:bifunctional chorismate-binding protein/class IV aminotransferase n=1 Tax=unclassified Campylobacter TaxID=2593542 RepID=UPI00224AF6E3|nr:MULTISPECIES: bifunctional anthranilate synthase component I family protein/aminotransferase class IV [unclassified Campylobacter]MCX2682961.1 bifunctional anthranilate synthase component I family protein/aminotransferase class IV [Campylobacter sp. MIT 21-1684]MCX2751243.1 bifunctional anthranilate synthase component I family protein/aminotransferase class IV [Campylobacter sp. MIT 21-1682]MCX2807442.1 bifunctional anthranilate synthase component I family protein/aminotransferase class IV [C
MIHKEFCVFSDFFYYDLAFSLYAHNQKESQRCFTLIEKYKNTFYFILCVEYEFYHYLYSKTYRSTQPYFCCFAYKKRKKFTPLKLDEEAFLPEVIHTLNKREYKKNFFQVKKAIAKGQSYQVNLTQSFCFKSKLDGFFLFNLLLPRQNTVFKAYIKTTSSEILSFSPELFFKINKKRIVAKPMKGTAPRDENLKLDKQRKAFLKQDDKNRSENVMITDLLRNDIAKLIKKNSLQAKLFQLTSYPTLHQMSSTVKGKLRKEIQLYSIFQALFPCGSISGCPKLETLKLIEKLEQRERGIYCGSIGLVHKKKAKFSVAIRTLQKRDSIYHYSVGSGLVWDSKCYDEFKELELKSAFLQPKKYFLFETLLYKNGTILFLKQHLQRLINSGLKLGFKTNKLSKNFQNILHTQTNFKDFTHLNLYEINKKLFFEQHSFLFPFDCGFEEGIIHIVLHKNGEYELNHSPLKENTSDILLISPITLYSKSDNLFHKSSLRSIYDTQSIQWQKNRCYDLAFFNEKKELCEGTRTNIIIKKDKQFYTPALQSGLLNGIYRNFLLKLNIIKEKRLFKEDLLYADALYCINSVRGLKKVRL